MILIMNLQTALTMMIGKFYWAYVPDPPCLHPMIWKGPEVVVIRNNTKLVDMPAGGNLTIGREINYQRLGIGVSMCIWKQNTTGCMRVSPTTLQEKDLDSITFYTIFEPGSLTEPEAYQPALISKFQGSTCLYLPNTGILD